MDVYLRTGEDFDLLAVGALHYHSRSAAYADILSAETLARLSAESLSAWWAERWKWERDTHLLTIAESPRPGSGPSGDGPMAGGGRMAGDGPMAGFTYVGPSELDGAAELYAIHVEPGLVGTGVGRLLMNNALDQMASIGGDRAVLWVLEANSRARRFYDRGGWTPDGGTRFEAVNGEPVPQLRYTHPLGEH